MTVFPSQTIGIIGGGQLGQMMALSAKEKGFVVGVLDPSPDCPASQVCDWQIVAPYDDALAIKKLADASDVLTYEFENVDAHVLEQYEEKGKLPQGTNLLKISQNRQLEKEFLVKHNIPVSEFRIVSSLDELKEACQIIGFPSVLKTIVGGYDGKGQIVLTTDSDIEDCLELLNQTTCILEKWVSFEKEISVIISNNLDGEVSVFPLAENHHVNNILFTSIAPAMVSKACEKQAVQLAKRISSELNACGTIAIEMFVTETEDLLVNEIAPRPHNSGHYTIEACSSSQFDTHILGICQWAMPTIDLFSSAIMVNLIGDEQTKAMSLVTERNDWYFHFYGKKVEKPGRKMGHITILSNSVLETLEEIQKQNVWK
ncbi:5-(carboxyamino)imidazole ribonucleotide synthase [Vagococcus bubulae]|uniref:N5-carboxyaminoimidazole ribonucleotide synthase n=1 Tax=Vagococcus bubulae TaxID=1977868 RepID=A0A429ZIW7_9ENTE|nr:5-(carboxyamino)imidazole ribonucleotide synthase [Vagococcus bubulae]RST93636.1 5-(carboxyamino)imidazole ribonucleotide synthase [Vagococcus bubulae]